MNTRSKMKVRFAAALAAGCAFLAFSETASAQEVELTGPLAGAPAVRQLRLYRKGRVEVAPQIAFTLLDQYQRTILGGLRLNYHFADWIGLGAWGAYGAIKMPTSLSEDIETTTAARGCSNGTSANPDEQLACRLIGPNIGPDFTDQLAKMDWVVAPQITLIPFRGKLGLFSSIYVDTDLYIFAGPAFVGIQERKDCKINCEVASTFEQQSRTAIAPTFGLGFSFYVNEWMALGAEYRMLPFSWNAGGLDTGGSGPDDDFPDNKIDDKDRQFEFNSMIGISWNMYFPTQYQISE